LNSTKLVWTMQVLERVKIVWGIWTKWQTETYKIAGMLRLGNQNF